MDLTHQALQHLQLRFLSEGHSVYDNFVPAVQQIKTSEHAAIHIGREMVCHMKRLLRTIHTGVVLGEINF